MKVVNRTKLPEKVPYSFLQLGDLFIFSKEDVNVFLKVSNVVKVIKPIKVVNCAGLPHPDLSSVTTSTMVYKVQLKHVEFEAV